MQREKERERRKRDRDSKRERRGERKSEGWRERERKRRTKMIKSENKTYKLNRQTYFQRLYIVATPKKMIKMSE